MNISMEMLKQHQSLLGQILEGKVPVPQEYTVKDGIVFYKKKPHNQDDDKKEDTLLVVVPRTLQDPLLYAAHEAAGHFGSKKTKSLLADHFYWPGIRRQVSQHCKTCPMCLQWNHQKEANLHCNLCR